VPAGSAQVLNPYSVLCSLYLWTVTKTRNDNSRTAAMVVQCSYHIPGGNVDTKTIRMVTVGAIGAVAFCCLCFPISLGAAMLWQLIR